MYASKTEFALYRRSWASSFDRTVVEEDNDRLVDPLVADLGGRGTSGHAVVDRLDDYRIPFVVGPGVRAGATSGCSIPTAAIRARAARGTPGFGVRHRLHVG